MARDWKRDLRDTLIAKAPLNEVELGESKKNLELFDQCTLEEHECGFRTKDGFCFQNDRCAYHLSEKYMENFDPNDKPTVETLLEIQRKAEHTIKKEDILAIVPEEEREYFTFLDEKKKECRSLFVVDNKGNIINLRTGRIIQRNMKI